MLVKKVQQRLSKAYFESTLKFYTVLFNIPIIKNAIKENKPNIIKRILLQILC